MFSTEETIRAELDSLKEDIRDAYRKSGKKVSGNFEEGLETVKEGASYLLKGYGYLAGRQAGDMPPVQEILKWVKDRGIKPFTESMTVSSLAWAISKSIAASGTNPENHLKIYEQVVTPARIQSILNNIVGIHIKEFIDEITTEFNLLTKDL
tara:strand:- start:307 stop:762 length:456 start_codon:yes stop_codon:yes gene_type:complete